VVKEGDGEGTEKKRGPRGGIKHTPGRGHATKSELAKKKRTGKRLKEKHRKRREDERRRMEAFERLSSGLKRLLKPEDIKIAEEEQ
jgi:hypothetical protein